MGLSDTKKAYVDAKLVTPIHFRDHMQIAGMLSAMWFFTHEKFPSLLGAVPDFHHISGFERFLESHRISYDFHELMRRFSRKNISVRFRDFHHTKNLTLSYQYAIHELIDKMKRQVEKDALILQHDLVAQNPAVFTALLSSPQNDAVSRGIALAAVNDQALADQLVTYYQENNQELRRLCYYPGFGISVEQARMLYFQVDSFLHHPQLQQAYVDKICDSKFLRKGGVRHFSPGFFGGLAASFFGLVTSGAIAGVVHVFAPVILSTIPWALAAFTGVVTVMFAIFVPMAIAKLVSRIVESVRENQQDRLELKIRKDMPHYHKMLNRYGIFEPELGDADERPVALIEHQRSDSPQPRVPLELPAFA